MPLSKLPELQTDIFLCHSSKDKGFVRKLAFDLECLKIKAWFDEWELEPGDSLIERIGDGIEKSLYLGVIVSPNSVSSNWCNTELNQALSRDIKNGKKTVIPLRLRGVESPPFLLDKFYLDFSTDYYSCLAKLGALIQQLDMRAVNASVGKTPPESIYQISELFGELIGEEFSASQDQEGWSAQQAYQRLKKLLKIKAISRNPDLYSMFGQICYDMGKYDEAITVFQTVLYLDPDFETFEKLDASVKSLAKAGEQLTLDKHTRIALAYIGLITENQDYVLNAAYGSTDPEVLFAAGTYWLSIADLDVSTGIDCFIRATESFDITSPWIRRCDEAIHGILHDKRKQPLVWPLIYEVVEIWNKHRWSLTLKKKK